MRDAERLKQNEAKEKERAQRELENHKGFVTRNAEREALKRQQDLDRALKAIEREREQLHQPGAVWFMGTKLWQEQGDQWLAQAAIILLIGFIIGFLTATGLRINIQMPGRVTTAHHSYQ